VPLAQSVKVLDHEQQDEELFKDDRWIVERGALLTSDRFAHAVDPRRDRVEFLEKVGRCRSSPSTWNFLLAKSNEGRMG
jgi:hypothetical protein